MIPGFHDDEIYPVERSADRSNAHYVSPCNVMGYQPAYCACLQKIAQRAKRTLSPAYVNCGNAIDSKSCPALPMQAEEVKAGRAIYYINRDKVREFEMAQMKSVGQRVGEPVKSHAPQQHKPRTTRTTNAPAAAPAGEISYTDVINAEMKKLNATPAPSKPEPKPVAAKPEPQKPAAPIARPAPSQAPAAAAPQGLSLLEMARRALAARAAQ